MSNVHGTRIGRSVAPSKLITAGNWIFAVKRRGRRRRFKWRKLIANHGLHPRSENTNGMALHWQTVW